VATDWSVTVDPSRGRVFDAIADTYARIRPGYPPEIIDALVTDARLRPGDRVLEIGAGPGIASATLLERGLRVLAVEPGAAMADAARSRLASADFDVVVSTFEEWPLEAHVFHLVLAATSIHWVHPEVRWAKSAAALLPSGAMALLTNVTVDGSTFSDLYRATADLHARYVGSGDTDSLSADELADEIDRTRHDIGVLWGAIEPYGGSGPASDYFAPPTVHTVPWERAFSAEDAIALLSTFSTYLVLEPTDRDALFTKMRRIIDEQFHGTVTRRYVAVLAVADVRAP
jgi:SAM-dependent methyltransferase